MERERIDFLLNLLLEKKGRELREELLKYNEADIAEFIEEIDEVETLAVFRLLPKDVAVDVFAEFDSEKQGKLLNLMTNIELTEIVDNLYIDDFVDMLEELPANIVKKIMKDVDPEKRNIINQYLQYPEDSVGSIMTAEFIDIKKHMTVGQALNKIRRVGMNSETIFTIYITDASRRLEGYLSIRTLLVNDEDKTIESLMDEDVIFVHTHDDQEVVAKIFSRYGFLAVPVVDNESRLVGMVTFDDAVDVIQEENTEDFELMAAMAPSEKPYMKSSAWEIAKNRFGWLIVLLLTAILTSSIITKYENILTSFTGVIAFLPMIIGTGGNAGSQSSTIVIRGLSLGEIKISDYYKVIIKELGVSIIVGLGLAIFNYLRIVVFGGSPSMALTISLTLLFTIMLAKTVGGLLPILAEKFKMDPAIMAAPLITTIVDTLSLMIYVVFVSIILI
ncbi:magnesium transporter [Helcococcus kunzii]|uniref:Magnesium transporter MgtE n=1 Tax=Helcococcus kunzii ATCC 51366 TaxID=883114 RepID=H3NPX0_9FIRM|nr:magnesium transporter [Helcococcus kunzii]EHR33348.1 magnesium transporter [Helcococcus kunzii ATCC 51366]MCT1796004.1 magnesium transporter [Helcococcus kunzii]MCT1988220.1 magnesium transporter [Helcococcus kunzii]QUY65285.1 magnesium transporter [Helcococcus kunzii]QZO75941.1 magnesium transporter [Helcococcus kunzii]